MNHPDGSHPGEAKGMHGGVAAAPWDPGASTVSCVSLEGADHSDLRMKQKIQERGFCYVVVSLGNGDKQNDAEINQSGSTTSRERLLNQLPVKESHTASESIGVM